MHSTDRSSNSYEMERPNYWTQSSRPRRPPCLPTISEHKEFHREEDYQRTTHRTMSNSQLIKTRRKRSSNGFTKLKRFEDDEFEGPEEERPLLGRHQQHSNKVHDEPGSEAGSSKPLKRSGFGWKLRKKRVKIVTASWSGQPRGRMLRKALSPLRLLRSMRDVYVRALNRLGDRCNQAIWFSVGARAI